MQRTCVCVYVCVFLSLVCMKKFHVHIPDLYVCMCRARERSLDARIQMCMDMYVYICIGRDREG